MAQEGDHIYRSGEAFTVTSVSSTTITIQRPLSVRLREPFYRLKWFIRELPYRFRRERPPITRRQASGLGEYPLALWDFFHGSKERASIWDKDLDG